jgi:hypothetical protein
MAKCQNCDAPNPEGYFNCRSCGKRASKPLYTIHTIMRDTPMATAIRKDLISFGTKDMGSHLKQVAKKNKELRDKKMKSLIKWD